MRVELYKLKPKGLVFPRIWAYADFWVEFGCGTRVVIKGCLICIKGMHLVLKLPTLQTEKKVRYTPFIFPDPTQMDDFVSKAKKEVLLKHPLSSWVNGEYISEKAQPVCK